MAMRTEPRINLESIDKDDATAAPRAAFREPTETHVPNLVPKIAGGIVLGWLAVTAIKAIFAGLALGAFAAAMR